MTISNLFIQRKREQHDEKKNFNKKKGNHLYIHVLYMYIEMRALFHIITIVFFVI